MSEELRKRKELIQSAEDQMAVMSRRSLLWSAAAIAAAYGGWRWFTNLTRINGLQWPLRKGLEFNEAIWKSRVDNKTLAPEFDRSLAERLRPNGLEGLDEDFDPTQWKLRVELINPNKNHRTFTLNELKQMKKTEMVTEFKCVEGWSQIVHWGGVRFSDFAATFTDQQAQNLYLATPGEKYFVGIDMFTAMHPQSLLAYEMNGRPLEPIHGAPLRLVTALKYGYKSIKRIELIRFTRERPRDFWEEYQYDWFAGH